MRLWTCATCPWRIPNSSSNIPQRCQSSILGILHQSADAQVGLYEDIQKIFPDRLGVTSGAKRGVGGALPKKCAYNLTPPTPPTPPTHSTHSTPNHSPQDLEVHTKASDSSSCGLLSDLLEQLAIFHALVNHLIPLGNYEFATHRVNAILPVYTTSLTPVVPARIWGLPSLLISEHVDSLAVFQISNARESS